MKWMAYQKPKTPFEALGLLHQSEGMARIIAGGTDLVPLLKHGKCRVDLLVDITDIKELKKIREEDGHIRIGAAVTHAEVAKSPWIQREAGALAEGCAQVGSPPIQNMATLVGNVVNAQPAADGAIPLMALEAELRVVSEEGERWVPMDEAYLGIGVSTIDSSREIVTEVRFRKWGERSGTGFFRMARRKALALPVLNGAVALLFDLSMNGIEKARISIGPVAQKPFRSRRAEAFLESEKLSPKTILEAARIASEESNPRTSLRGSAFYRKAMIRIHLQRTIERIFEEAKKKR
jgi:CO/xanthine dehydrogenase FAD-binding subunit